MEEVWKKIKSYPNYEISSFGKVKNLTTNENMKLRKRDDKYIDVGLTKNGEQKNELLHRLVAKAFCKKQPGEIDVDHIDKNRSNNKSNNLRWATSKENAHNRVLYKNNTSGYKGVYWNKQKNILRSVPKSYEIVSFQKRLFKNEKGAFSSLVFIKSNPSIGVTTDFFLRIWIFIICINKMMTNAVVTRNEIANA